MMNLHNRSRLCFAGATAFMALFLAALPGGAETASPGAAVHAEAASPAAIVQRQVDAYNAHDLEQFAATYADDVEITDTKKGEVVIRGKARLREVYGRLFQTYPDVHAEIMSRRVVDHRYVIDREIVTGAGEPAEAEVRYEVCNQLITRVWL